MLKDVPKILIIVFLDDVIIVSAALLIYFIFLAIIRRCFLTCKMVGYRLLEQTDIYI